MEMRRIHQADDRQRRYDQSRYRQLFQTRKNSKDIIFYLHQSDVIKTYNHIVSCNHLADIPTDNHPYHLYTHGNSFSTRSKSDNDVASNSNTSDIKQYPHTIVVWIYA
ncbi:TPA: hypothetical protein DCZ39_06570 [Patescibacteria group bacterium]|nr:hypothetical protein [Candidatus Gracilibacteria bacterium]